VDPSQIEHKLDLSHFKTPEGRPRPVDTVKIIAWATDTSKTAGAMAGRDWVRQLLSLMGMEGTVIARVSQPRVADIQIDSPRAPHLVGRQGITLRSIKLLLEAALAADWPDWRWELSVDGGARREDRDERWARDDDRPRRFDDRPRRDDDRPRRDDDRPRRFDDRPRRDDDRPRRFDDRPRRDDNRPRRDDDRPRRDDDRGRDEGDARRSDRDVERLRELTHKLAREAIETNSDVRFRKPLNSYERRIVHMEVSGIEGVVSESEGEGSLKTIVIRPGQASAEG
jgi:predicted RNA-binding protein Jag